MKEPYFPGGLVPFLRAAASPHLQAIIAKQVCDSPVARSSYFFFSLQEKPEMWILIFF